MKTSILEKPFISLNTKLMRFTVKSMIIIGVTVLLAGLITFLFEYRRRLSQIQISTKNVLINKGKLLVSNNSIALRQMAEDNAFSAIKELVSSTVFDDSDIFYGIYMDNDLRPWVYIDKNRDDNLFNEYLDDIISQWASNIDFPDYRYVKIHNEEIIEFAAPVKSTEQKLGTIRYGISTASTNRAIAEMRNDFTRYIVFYMISFICAGLIIFFLELNRCRKQAATITRPLCDLREAAGTISNGNYYSEVKIDSNDEMGILAQNFELMRQTIRNYTTNLQKMVKERTRALEAAQKELVVKAHQAGMADIAIGTLHNVGNILNSVNISVQMLEQLTSSSPQINLQKANNLLRQNQESFIDFMTKDPKGPKLLQYYLKLEDSFELYNDKIIEQINRLTSKVKAIHEVIMAQQSYVNAAAVTESASIEEVVEDALTMQKGSIDRYNINVIKKFPSLPSVRIQKTKLIHVLINFINNAKEAMIETPPEKRELEFIACSDNAQIVLKVRDTGYGVAPENVKKIFSHGFTTKINGHGFGLHSSANYIKEMNGKISVESPGPGFGSTFIITLPLWQE
ncbi:MAG TPA: ATP-binding protein [Chitinispirillaceae bacterium]|nr:ATP-binding protein [Chitinispirillaceae bacterium]